MDHENKDNRGRKNSVKEFFNFGPVLGYFFRKKDPDRPKNFNLKMMHGVNKLSILMFLVALTVIIYRFLTR